MQVLNYSYFPEMGKKSYLLLYWQGQCAARWLTMEDAVMLRRPRRCRLAHTRLQRLIICCW